MSGRGLLDWLADPDPRHGLRFLGASGSWERLSYPTLAALALGTAERLRADGVSPGDVVGLTADAGPGFLTGLYGILAAGATPAPLAPPALFERGELARDRLRGQLLTSGAVRVVADPCWADVLRPLVPVVGTLLETGSSSSTPPRCPPSRVLVQFTSGSGGRPKAVNVPLDALEANVAAIRDWLRMGPDDATASWLPPYHDMGLVGCLLTPVTYGGDLWVMSPRQFVRDPVAWLACFGEHRARLTAAPAFGLAHVVRRVKPGQLDGLGWDLRAWRALITGAERVDPVVVERFVALLAPHGFLAHAVLPAYGLAEATLAVTGVPPGRGLRVRRVDRHTLVAGRRVRPVPVRTAVPTPASTPTPALDAAVDRALDLVGCGAPLVASSAVGVVDAAGRPLPDEYVGEITVTGPALASGYLRAEEEEEKDGDRTSAFNGGVLRTGDLGFRSDGELFVLGRLGDAVKCRGRVVLAEDVEGALAGVPELAGARPVVLLGVRHGVPTALVVAERRSGPWCAAAVEAVRRRGEGLDVRVIAGGPGTILRTTSGKPRRRAMWDATAERACADDR
ncbi:AMP-binding protein [Streptomyces sp. NPDC048278]|uniref:AMP-binding protein n=1 Tax=Streptomyces sp. NPDC048278 TaxID=3155809 RepID=UPI0034483FE9